MSRTLRFGAVVGVKDEVELILPCIDHLRRIGVDAIHVVDAGSTDGTLEALAPFVGQPGFALSHEDTLDPDPTAWSRRIAAAARASGADWVLFLDADEFWMPAGGSMHAVRWLDALDVVTVDRFNVPLDGGGLLTDDRRAPSLAHDLSLIVEPLPDFRRRMEADPDLPWIRIVPARKVMARADRIASIGEGFHTIQGTPGPPLRSARARDLLIAHVPFSTIGRFARKVANIHRVFAVHDDYFGQDMAWHWRRLLACRDDDAIRREFQLQVFDDAQLRQLRDSGVVQRRSQRFAAAGVAA